MTSKDHHFSSYFLTAVILVILLSTAYGVFGIFSSFFHYSHKQAEVVQNELVLMKEKSSPVL